jgi:LCP family protein required for cell wall assembly
VTPPEKGNGEGKPGDADETERIDQTEEHRLEDDFEDEEYQQEELPEEDELEQIVSAETQEWEGIDAAESDEHPTMAASARQRVRQAGSAVTSGFDRVRDTGAFQRVRRWRPGFPLWLRFTTASFVIVASVAAATSASLILYLGDIASALRHNDLQGVEAKLTKITPGDPETIMILGSDKRPEDKGTSFKGLSDTTMLLRLDPSRDAISLFSLPRDLKVEIPGYGTDKLNAAYAYGGPQLTLQTVENLLSTPGQPFEVNHLVNVDFEGFARAVNAIDCVYVDVDRRYYHINTPGSEQYEEINIQPGYQALCGFDALDFARYRHTDNDVVRAARQQEFLREARAKIPPETLFSDRKELISIFTEHTSSDINDPGAMLEVLKLFLAARDKPIKEVHFEGTLGPSFVTATSSQLHQAVNQFLGIQGTPGAKGQSAAPEEPVSPERAPDATKVTPAATKPAPPPPTGNGPVDNDYNLVQTSFGKDLAKKIRARRQKVPIYYPTLIESGSDFDQKPRVYKVNGTGKGSPPDGERAAYKWVFARPVLGEYYGFEGTLWKDPPILNDPDETIHANGEDYELFYDNDRLRIVAWKTDQGAFWLTNTLIESLSNREMLKMAESFRELPQRD